MGSVLAARLRAHLHNEAARCERSTEEGGVLLIARVSVTSSVIFEVKLTLINLGGTDMHTEPLLTWQKSLMFHARSPLLAPALCTSCFDISKAHNTWEPPHRDKPITSADPT